MPSEHPEPCLEVTPEAKRLDLSLQVISCVWEEHSHGRSFPDTIGKVLEAKIWHYRRMPDKQCQGYLDEKVVLLTTVYRPQTVTELKQSHLQSLFPFCEELKLKVVTLCNLQTSCWDDLIPGGETASEVGGTIPSAKLVSDLGVETKEGNNMVNGLFLLRGDRIVYSWIAANSTDKPTPAEYEAIKATVDYTLSKKHSQELAHK